MKTPSLVALLFVAVAYAGGWNLVTMKEFPDFAVAGKPLKLAFKVWVPSEDPLHVSQPLVNATDARQHVIKVKAKTGAAVDQFTATLIFPEPGDWVITIDAEYPRAATMPSLKVIAPGTSPPDPLSLASRGQRLFTAKGCNGCHLHEDLQGRIYGPDLTGKSFPTEYLRKFLADPSITPVPDMVCSKDGYYCGSPYAMPNLHLKNAEIDALVAFINKK